MLLIWLTACSALSASVAKSSEGVFALNSSRAALSADASAVSVPTNEPIVLDTSSTDRALISIIFG